MHPYLSTQREQRRLPDEADVREMVKKESQWVKENVEEKKLVIEVQKFTMTAPGPGPESQANWQTQRMSYSCHRLRAVN